MRSLIAYNVKTNVCLVSNKIFIVRIILCATVQNCSKYTTTICLFVILITRTIIQIFTTAIFKPRLFCTHTTSHKADGITTTRRLHCLPFLQLNTISLTKVLEVERSCSLHLKKFYCYFNFVRVVLVAFAYLSYPLCAHIVVGGLLVTSMPHLFMQLLVYLCNRLVIVVGWYSVCLLFS